MELIFEATVMEAEQGMHGHNPMAEEALLVMESRPVG